MWVICIRLAEIGTRKRVPALSSNCQLLPRPPNVQLPPTQNTRRHLAGNWGESIAIVIKVLLMEVECFR